MNTEHKVVEAMAASWDEPGHRHPWNWHIECSCGWRTDGLRNQTAASDAWRAHRAAATEEAA